MRHEIIIFGSIFTDTMAEMTWEEVKKAAEYGSVVLLPIAVVEEHGPHLDLSIDIYLTYLICRFIKHELKEKGIESVVAPPYYWGINECTKNFPGSFRIKPETFKAILHDIIESLQSWGFRKIFCISVHGDPTHNNIMDSSIQEIKENLSVDVYSINVNTLFAELNPFSLLSRPGKFAPDYHAGADETAWIQAFYPDKVNVEIAKKLKPQAGFEPLGYFGDPAGFELEPNAKEAFLTIAKRWSALIESYLKNEQRG
ncbi:MAG TPA: creatininase family protein [Bacillota bacterium]